MLKFFSIYLFFSDTVKKIENRVKFEMPVGMYTDARLDFISGFCTPEQQIMFDDGNYFRPDRAQAQLLWASSGFAEYTFINPYKNVKAIELSLEICSETLGWQTDWKSDISFSINNVPLCVYTSEGDYGDRRGLLNPDWWPNTATQYGKKIYIRADRIGVSLDGKRLKKNADYFPERVFDVPRLVLRIENKDSAVHRGGFNLFGKGFGDDPNDITLTLELNDD